jgi:mono/diheme cytochrome c family protein
MPGFGSTLTDEEIWAVLAYIKSGWPGPIRERQREFSLANRGQ